MRWYVTKPVFFSFISGAISAVMAYASHGTVYAAPLLVCMAVYWSAMYICGAIDDAGNR